MRIIPIDIIIPEKHFLCFLIRELDSKFCMGRNHSIIAIAGKRFIYHVEAENPSFCFWLIRLSCSQNTCAVRSQTSCSVWLTFIFSALNPASKYLPVGKYILLLFFVQPENNL